MRIREQGQWIKLLRAERGEHSRRRRHVVIGVFRVDEAVPAELIQQLDWTEQQEFSRWFAAWRDGRAMAQARGVLAEASTRLDELVVALEVAAGQLTSAEADALWHKLQAIARGLRRGGHPRPKRAVSPPGPFPGQLDLIDTLSEPSIPLMVSRDVFVE